jgi:hypothetical protein
MSATVLEQVVAGRVEALAHWARASQGGRAALTADEVADAVQECLEYPDALKRLVRRAAHRLFHPDAAEDLNEGRRSLLARLDAALDAMEAVQPLADAFDAPQRQALSDAVAEVRRLKDETFRHWPEMTPPLLDEARERMRRGEGVPLDEAFAEAAGVSVEEFRRRVEARRQARKGG